MAVTGVVLVFLLQLTRFPLLISTQLVSFIMRNFLALSQPFPSKNRDQPGMVLIT